MGWYYVDRNLEIEKGGASYVKKSEMRYLYRWKAKKEEDEENFFKQQIVTQR
jgi:hypothetical protein